MTGPGSNSVKAALIELLVHIAVGSVVFILIACISAAIDLFIGFLTGYSVSSFLLSTLSFVKKGILVLDVLLLIVFLANISLHFVTSLNWQLAKQQPDEEAET